VRGNRYTILFALSVCVVLSVLLSANYMALKDRQELNRKLDRQKNILIAAGFEPQSQEEVQGLFDTRVKAMVVDASGEVVLGRLPDQIDPKAEKNLLPIYRITKEGDAKATKTFVYPVSGKGLWSTMYGYLAVSPDGKSVKGLTFYQQGETPGLGAEVEKAWFRDQFVGKKLYDNGKVVGVRVVKGKARDQMDYKTKGEHMVDGISGATITCNGVSKMMKVDPKKYSAFFRKRG